MFKLLRGLLRAFFGFCPECNSSAPEIYKCRICRYDTQYPPTFETTKERWHRFINN